MALNIFHRYAISNQRKVNIETATTIRNSHGPVLRDAYCVDDSHAGVVCRGGYIRLRTAIEVKGDRKN